MRRLWPLAAALALVLAFSIVLSTTRYGRAAVTSAFFLPDMMVTLPVRPVTWFTADPIREEVTIDYGSDSISADIYRPGGEGEHAAIVFSMGAPPMDRDDSRLVKLAEDVARAGVVMLVPFSERLDAELIEPEEVEALVGAFQYLRAQDYVDAEKVGYIGVSVGASLALLAASDKSISDEVDLLVSFGGYFNALDTLSAVSTHHISYDGLEEEWEPRHHSVRVMARQLIDKLASPVDRQVLERIFVDRESPDEAGLSRLSPLGRACYDFLTNRDPARVDELLAGLPAEALRDLRLLSPSRTLEDVRAEIFIVHDRGDPFIPYVESRRMRDRLAGRDDLHYTEVSLFEHVEPNLRQRGDILVLDSARLYFRLYQLLLRLT
jgi:acetyl esterase/lipase